jgi:hypothetical protein
MRRGERIDAVVLKIRNEISRVTVPAAKRVLTCIFPSHHEAG